MGCVPPSQQLSKYRDRESGCEHGDKHHAQSLRNTGFVDEVVSGDKRITNHWISLSTVLRMNMVLGEVGRTVVDRPSTLGLQVDGDETTKELVSGVCRAMAAGDLAVS